MGARTQQQYAETFRGLHRKGDPLVLFNAWDVATATAIAKTSPAVATSSAAVASALGYADGEDVPLDMVTGLVSRMTAAVSVPVSIDLEAGYGDTPDAAAKSVTEILKAGAIGINIEDGLFGGKRQLVSLEQHAEKIKAVRDTAQKLGIHLFINARTEHHGDARCSRNPGSRARRCSAGEPWAVAHDGGDACHWRGRRRGRRQQAIRHVSATESLSTSWGASQHEPATDRRLLCGKIRYEITEAP
jgi:2-methylisocitrate lyase-like PEP mutase family enzyme